MSCAAILVAAGRGERAGGGVPKQYRDLAGKMVLERTLERFLGHPAVDDVVVVINPDDAAFFAGIDAPVLWVNGGATRTASVRAGLAALESRRPDQVLIHDAARPFVSDRVISDVVDALADAPAALPVLPVTDALLAHADGNMCESVDRDRLRAAQTPQGFRLDALLNAYEKLGEASAHDDASVALAAGLEVHLTLGEAGNFKLTTPEDFERAEALLGKTDMIYVTGQGFDVHRLEPSDHMYLCGVRLDQDFGLVGHSDADVGLHALTDAILGAAGEGDIGQHFPPTDPQWRGASSDRFLMHACQLLKNAGGALVNADITLICERPKVGPYRDEMRARVAELVGLPLARVNIKATTTEKLGFTGRREGVAAQAIVTARMPEDV